MEEFEDLEKMDEALEQAAIVHNISTLDRSLFDIAGVDPSCYLALCDKCSYHGKFYPDACYIYNIKTRRNQMATYKTDVRHYRKKPVVITAYQTDHEFDIETLEGVEHASVGDYIITGVDGEQYPCKPGIFEKTYEEVKNTSDPINETIKNL